VRTQGVLKNWIDRGELGGVRLGSRRVRVLASELDRFVSESTAARNPNQDDAQSAFTEAMSAVQAAGGDVEKLVHALRELSTAAVTLARVLSRRADVGAA
jgi:hypothetical protein